MLLYLYFDDVHRTPYWFKLTLLATFCSFATPEYARAMIIFSLPYIVIYLAFLPTRRVCKFGELFGDTSYGIYIYAFPIQQAYIHYFGVSGSIIIYIGSTFLITFILALLSWQLIEKRALLLKWR